MKKSFKRSCLRWPGGKYSLLNEIIPLINIAKFNSYHEPFVGSASVFLNVNNAKSAFLSDSNENLINFYSQVQGNLKKLISKIQTKENSENFFYAEREKSYKSPVERAAQFYFLNRTCFNGIYRVNSLGKFNVPYGKRKDLIVADVENLTHLHKKLIGVTINRADFLKSAKDIKSGDLVYFDPPYRSKTNSRNFLMYNETLFSWEDQLSLQNLCKKLMDKKVKIIINNLYNEEVFNLFNKELKLKTIITKRYSVVGSQIHSRGQIQEYLFTNI
jgi:DNA adenine methylase